MALNDFQLTSDELKQLVDLVSKIKVKPSDVVGFLMKAGKEVLDRSINELEIELKNYLDNKYREFFK